MNILVIFTLLIMGVSSGVNCKSIYKENKEIIRDDDGQTLEKVTVEKDGVKDFWARRFDKDGHEVDRIHKTQDELERAAKRRITEERTMVREDENTDRERKSFWKWPWQHPWMPAKQSERENETNSKRPSNKKCDEITEDDLYVVGLRPYKAAIDPISRFERRMDRIMDFMYYDY